MAAKSALPESESATPGLDASLSTTVLWVAGAWALSQRSSPRSCLRWWGFGRRDLGLARIRLGSWRRPSFSHKSLEPALLSGPPELGLGERARRWVLAS